MGISVISCKELKNARLILFLPAIIVAFCLSALIASAGTDDSVSDSAFITISLVNQAPEPVGPGEKLELKFNVENRGTEPAKDVVVEMVPRFPFLVDDSEKTKALGSLSGRQKGKDAVLVRFFLTVDSGAGYGINQVGIRYKTATQGWTLIDNFNVSVGQRDLPLAVISVSTVPEALVPGKESVIKLDVANLGKTDALNVRVRLNFSDSLPFTAYGTTNEVLIPRIAQGAVATASFTVITDPDASSAVYPVPVFMRYVDNSGRNYTLSGETFGVAVSSKPELTAAVLDNELLKFNSKRKVSVEIINAGLTDVKFLTAALLKSGSYEVLSAGTTYVGDIDSDDSETVSYDVFLTTPGPLMLQLDYFDALNNPHRQLLELPVKVYSSSDIRKFGLEKSNSKGLLVTVAIVIVGLLAYRKFRKKK